MNAWQFDAMILRPTLAALSPLIPVTETGRRLLLGTIAHESGGFQFIDQKTSGPDVDGPAYGLAQMERATHDDIWDTFLAFRPELAAKVNRLKLPGIESCKQMQGNLYYATAMARMKYYRAKPPLPGPDDIFGMARYYKMWYNSPDGKASPADFEAAVSRYLQGVW